MESSKFTCCEKCKNVLILRGTDNLFLDAPEDIVDGIIEIESNFKRLCTYVNVFICGVLPRDCYWSINRVYEIKVCPVFVQLYSLRHRLNYDHWFPKSRTFLFWQNWSGKKRAIQSFLNIYAYTTALRISRTLEISTVIS